VAEKWFGCAAFAKKRFSLAHLIGVTLVLLIGLLVGDRCLIVFPLDACPDYLVAFVGCVRIGVVPVSVYPPNPTKLDSDLKKLSKIVALAGAKHVVTHSKYNHFVTASRLVKKWPKLDWISTDSIYKKKPSLKLDSLVHQADDLDVAFIQFTSGSTGDPKGCPIHHKSLVANCRAMSENTIPGSNYFGQRGFLWVPIYHDMGLISTLAGAYGCGENFMMR